jgi:hypothetical protein
MPLELTILAYLAGVIDSDGYITASSSVRKGRIYAAPRVGISGTRRQPHDLAASIYGGSVRAYEPKNDRAHHRTQYQWVLEGDKAAVVIGDLSPYLLVKKTQAELAMQLQEARVEARAARTDEDPYPWAPAGYDPTPSMVALAEDIRALNVRGRELDGRTWDEFPDTKPLEVATHA